LIVKEDDRSHTRVVFHIPFENSQPLMKAIVQNATLTAMKTPVGPKPSGCAAGL
jgi:hypothetical protein